MAVYVISDVAPVNQEAFSIYKTHAASSIAKYGGRYIVRGGEIKTLEGSWDPTALVIVEFPTAEQARIWYKSPEYAVALAIRDSALSRNLILVRGVEDSGHL